MRVQITIDVSYEQELDLASAWIHDIPVHVDPQGDHGPFEVKIDKYVLKD